MVQTNMVGNRIWTYEKVRWHGMGTSRGDSDYDSNLSHTKTMRPKIGRFVAERRLHKKKACNILEDEIRDMSKRNKLSY